MSDQELKFWRDPIRTDNFHRVVELTEASLFRFLYSLLQNPADVDDAKQQTYLNALKNADSFKAPWRLKPYIYRIAYNVAMEIKRKNKRGPIFTSETNDWPDPLGEELPPNSSLKKALATIAAEDREMLILRYFENLSIKAISQIFGISYTAANSRMSRARMELRTYLDDE